MNLSNVVTEHYNIKPVGIDNIANLADSTSSIFKFLKQNRKRQFESNEKLLIISKLMPTPEFLTHLKRAAALVDIERFYIAFLMPELYDNVDVAGFSQFKIDTALIEDLDYAENFADTSKLCPMPFMHTMVDILGSYRPCCVYKKGLFNTNTHTIAQFFNSTEMNDLRNTFLTNGNTKNCNHCWDLESKGAESHRQRNFKFYQEEFLTKFVDNPKISTMDLRLGNTCNFNCRICSPRESSKIAGQLLKFDKTGEIKDLIKRGKWFDNDPAFIN